MPEGNCSGDILGHKCSLRLTGQFEHTKNKEKMPTKFSRKIAASVKDFAEHTSAHGLPRASNSRGLRKVLWLLLFFSCLGAFCLQAYHIINRFSRNDIIVGVELKFENIHFPSVTVCNLNPYKNSLARLMGSVRDTLIAFDDAIEKSDKQNKKTKRSIKESELDYGPEQILAEHRCNLFDGMFVPNNDGTDSCYCRYHKSLNVLLDCGLKDDWEIYISCSSCNDHSGLCISPKYDDTHQLSSTSSDIPCHCHHSNCVRATYNTERLEWPLTVISSKCDCYNNYCAINRYGSYQCTCIQLFSSETVSYCERNDQWSSSKCSECFGGGACIRSITKKGEDCICNSQDECFKIKSGNQRVIRDLTAADKNVIRTKKQIQKLYEKIYSSYEGLLAVYSICECKGTNCKALKNSNDGGICLCFYNKKNSQIWPCYPPDMWTERRCNKCSPLGDCVYNDKAEGKLPCVCASVIRMCVRIEERTPEEEVLATDIASAEEQNTTDSSVERSSFVLGNRIPKIWEFTTTTEAPVSDEEASDKEMAYGLKGIEDPVAIRATAVENLIFAVNELNSSEIERLGYDKREFITKCSFNGRQCSIEDDFSVYIDPSFGNCFTFNYNKSKMIRSERAGSNYGLRFQVFVNISDYLPTTEAAGVRITVHSPSEQPFPDTHGYSAPTGFVSSFAIRLKSINRLPMPYGQCVEDGKDEDYIFHDKEYSTEGCQRTCIQKYLVQKCGCGDPRFPVYQNSTNCPVAVPSLRDCLRSEMKYAARLDSCICQQPCNQEVYTVSYSCARWPSGQAAGTSQECGPLLSPAQCLHFHREQAAMIEVYFEQLNYESLKESEAYGFPNLLSDFGGQLGLWMGVSVITIMEVGILFTDIVIGFFSSICCCGTSIPPTQPQFIPVKEKVSKRRRGPVHANGHAIPYIDYPLTNSYDIIRSFK